MTELGRTAAVLGASGFLGGAVARELAVRGIPCTRFTRAEPFLIDGELAAPLHTADIVFWLVSSIRPATSAASDKASTDRMALQALLERLASRAVAPRLVAVSSGGTVYDMNYPPPYSERSAVCGANAYGKAMIEVEELLREWAPDHVVLRASNAYGPGQPARRGQGVIAHWLDSIKREEPIRVLGDAATRRDYIYISDLVRALLGAALTTDVPRLLNVGAGQPTSLTELIELIRATVGFDFDVEYSPARSFDAPSNWLDVSLAASALGLRPAVPLAVGLREAWRFTLST